VGFSPALVDSNETAIQREHFCNGMGGAVKSLTVFNRSRTKCQGISLARFSLMMRLTSMKQYAPDEDIVRHEWSVSQVRTRVAGGVMRM
jgi:hypothetical protein